MSLCALYCPVFAAHWRARTLPSHWPFSSLKPTMLLSAMLLRENCKRNASPLSRSDVWMVSEWYQCCPYLLVDLFITGIYIVLTM